jgi:hypothetical protein
MTTQQIDRHCVRWHAIVDGHVWSHTRSVSSAAELTRERGYFITDILISGSIRRWLVCFTVER